MAVRNKMSKTQLQHTYIHTYRQTDRHTYTHSQRQIRAIMHNITLRRTYIKYSTTTLTCSNEHRQLRCWMLIKTFEADIHGDQWRTTIRHYNTQQLLSVKICTIIIHHHFITVHRPITTRGRSERTIRIRQQKGQKVRLVLQVKKRNSVNCTKFGQWILRKSLKLFITALPRHPSWISGAYF